MKSNIPLQNFWEPCICSPNLLFLFVKYIFWGYLFLFVEYICNCSPERRTRNVKKIRFNMINCKLPELAGWFTLFNCKRPVATFRKLLLTSHFGCCALRRVLCERIFKLRIDEAQFKTVARNTIL